MLARTHRLRNLPTLRSRQPHQFFDLGMFGKQPWFRSPTSTSDFPTAEWREREPPLHTRLQIWVNAVTTSRRCISLTSSGGRSDGRRPPPGA
jgi:hypothetical protein